MEQLKSANCLEVFVLKEEYCGSEHDYCFSFELYSKRWIAVTNRGGFSR